MPKISSPQHEWRCEKCGLLLGVDHAGKLHITYKEALRYIIEGVTIGACRRCGRLNQYGSSLPTPATATIH